MNNQYNNYNNGYNNFNNGYNNYNNYNPNNNFNNWNQMPQPNMNSNNDDSNKGGGFFSFLIALIILMVAVVFLLHLTGVINVKELYNKYILKKEDTTEITDKKDESKDQNDTTSDSMKKELDNLCTLVDNEGSYSDEKNKKVNCIENICIIIDVDDETLEKIQNENSEDISEEQIKNIKINAKNCQTGEYSEKKFGEIFETLQANTALQAACSNVDADGNYSYKSDLPESDNVYNCSNFTCTVTIDGRQFTKECTH